ncbi:hypothetical protein CCO03_07370 [Comamonas serinivorans]|uniref:DUF3108 domain-containing protein n=1 Tax=Comamonas serinivorans TaxID=1082851 RepID=A0A1Y0EM44_9BURK|nr:DUF3108 domain-containing protein [Comamonas serinivorans]ARU04521.1 hypothetical protein CCO03_07370 [Comamonas serinivorans]
MTPSPPLRPHAPRRPRPPWRWLVALALLVALGHAVLLDGLYGLRQPHSLLAQMAAPMYTRVLTPSEAPPPAAAASAVAAAAVPERLQSRTIAPAVPEAPEAPEAPAPAATASAARDDASAEAARRERVQARERREQARQEARQAARQQANAARDEALQQARQKARREERLARAAAAQPLAPASSAEPGTGTDSGTNNGDTPTSHTDTAAALAAAGSSPQGATGAGASPSSTGQTAAVAGSSNLGADPFTGASASQLASQLTSPSTHPMTGQSASASADPRAQPGSANLPPRHANPAASPGQPPDTLTAARDGASAAQASGARTATGSGHGGASAKVADAWPPNTRLAYTLRGNYRGELHGTARVLWQTSGTQYQAQVELDLGLLASMRLTSQGELTAQSLVPRVYEELMRKKRRNVRLGTESLHLANDETLPRPPGVQDTASQFIELSHRFASGQVPLAVGQTVNFALARPNRVAQWTYDVVEDTQLQLPQLGTTRALLVKPRPIEGDTKGISAQMWLAPSLQYLPVRILLTTGNGDQQVDLLLQQVDQGDAPR